MSSILITGGTGLIGSHLIPLFEAAGHHVSLLSRTKASVAIQTFQWDPERGYIDPTALLNTDTIINLAGAGIADKRWTNSYKRKILQSRVNSANLLYETLKNTNHSVKTVISASAVGYYGDTGETWVDEAAHPIDNFLGTTCVQWEKTVRQIESLGIRVVILRIGVILAKNGGALPAMSLPVKLFLGAPLGTGNQYIPWIHIDDLCSIFSFAVQNEKLHGVFNAVAPGPVQNKFFMKQLARVLKRPLWPFPVPEFLMRMILGQKADIVLNGQRATCEKIRLAGYKFKTTDLDTALRSLL